MAFVPPAAQDDLVRVITKDHREIELILAELQLGEGTPEHRRDLADHLTAELVRHAAAEEMYMYPAIRRARPDRHDVADRAIAEHSEIEHILKELEGVDGTDSQFDELVGKLISEVRHHVLDEEQQVLPQLQEACSVEELQELGRMVVRAKDSAPTRPHPSAPDKPPANLILGPGVGMIDRLRDALTRRNRS